MTSASPPRKLTVQQIIAEELDKLIDTGYSQYSVYFPKGEVYVEVQFNVNKFSEMVAKRIEDNQ